MHSALYNLIRPHYQTLQGYVSAGMEATKDSSRIFMNANENPYELPELEGLNRYPQPQPAALLDGYAKMYGVQPDQIVMTRGADEAIVVLTNLFCEPHNSAMIITPPTFGMYGRSAGVMPAATREVPLIKEGGTYTLDVDGIIAAAKEPASKLVFLCSPNNPTGTALSHDDIARICREAEGHAAVILDETYAEFARAGSMAARLSEFPNMIILRTLSKSYALAGARMGSLLCADSDFIALIRAKSLDAYPLPVSSVNAALHVMKPEIQKLAKDNIKKLLSERDRLRTHFEGSTLIRHIYPSDANFLLIEMDKARDFVRYCATQNIILRDFSDKAGTTDCIRISPALPEQNDLLIKCLMDFERLSTS